MATLKNHPGYSLRDDAAAAFNAAEDKYGIFSVNDAMRTVAQQQHLIDLWNKGGAANRPPYLYEPAQPASTSNHVKNGGIALDIGNWSKFASVCAEFGFSHPYPGGDPVHFEFVGGGAAPAASGNQATRDRQNFLNSRGWHLVTDGVEGALTRQAYKEYQTYLKNRGWYTGAIDGVWGAGTQAAHDIFWHEINPPAAPAASGALSYAQIQQGLNKFGYNLTVDGVWGTKSSNALADFQRNHGLTVDRLVGPKTRAALGI